MAEKLAIDTSTGESTLVPLTPEEEAQRAADAAEPTPVTRPTIAAGPALGTNPPAPTIDGNDRSGYITIGTGTTPASGGVAATVTFARPFVNTPVVILQGTTGAVVDRAPYVDISTITRESFQIRVRGALPAGVTPGKFLAYQVFGG